MWTINPQTYLLEMGEQAQPSRIKYLVRTRLLRFEPKNAPSPDLGVECLSPAGGIPWEGSENFRRRSLLDNCGQALKVKPGSYFLPYAVLPGQLESEVSRVFCLRGSVYPGIPSSFVIHSYIICHLALWLPNYTIHPSFSTPPHPTPTPHA